MDDGTMYNCPDILTLILQLAFYRSDAESLAGDLPDADSLKQLITNSLDVKGWVDEVSYVDYVKLTKRPQGLPQGLAETVLQASNMTMCYMPCNDIAQAEEDISEDPELQQIVDTLDKLSNCSVNEFLDKCQQVFNTAIRRTKARTVTGVAKLASVQKIERAFFTDDVRQMMCIRWKTSGKAKINVPTRRLAKRLISGFIALAAYIGPSMFRRDCVLGLEVDRRACDQLLSVSEAGSYVLRLCSSQPGALVLGMKVGMNKNKQLILFAEIAKDSHRVTRWKVKRNGNWRFHQSIRDIVRTLPACKNWIGNSKHYKRLELNF